MVALIYYVYFFPDYITGPSGPSYISGPDSKPVIESSYKPSYLPVSGPSLPSGPSGPSGPSSYGPIEPPRPVYEYYKPIKPYKPEPYVPSYKPIESYKPSYSSGFDSKPYLPDYKPYVPRPKPTENPVKPLRPGGDEFSKYMNFICRVWYSISFSFQTLIIIYILFYKFLHYTVTAWIQCCLIATK